ncbi:MAG: hypothetical protein JXQ97_13580 [Natronospirillum sp.]
MYSRAISNKQPIHSVLLAAGLLLFLVTLSAMPICGNAHTHSHAHAATSSMGHTWTDVEQRQEEHHCHSEDFAQELLAQAKKAKPELQADFTLLQTLNFSGLLSHRPDNNPILSSHFSSTAPVFLLTQRLRI